VNDWRARIIAAAESWLKTPWAHNQSVKGKGGGVDCGRYLLACYVEPGLVDDSALGSYPADWMLHRSEERFLGWVERYLDPVERPLPGDVAVWKFGRCFSHGAIVVDWPQIIHAYIPCRMVTRDDASKGDLVGREVRFYSLAARLGAQ
jgi:cell wall-associated NlpC family hydrolase